MSSPRIRKVKTSKSPGHDTRSDHDISLKAHAETPKPVSDEFEHTEIRKSSRKRTLKCFEDFYVGIASSDDRGKSRERIETGDAKRAGKLSKVKSESVLSVAVREVPKASRRIGRKSSPSNAVDDSSKRRNRKTNGLPVSSDTISAHRKIPSKAKPQIQDCPESTPISSLAAADTGEGQLRKSSRKRKIKRFDKNFVDDRRAPKPRQKICLKRSKPDQSDSAYESQSRSAVEMTEEESDEGSPGAMQSMDDSKLQMTTEQSSSGDKSRSVTSELDVKDYSDEDDKLESIQSDYNSVEDSDKDWKPKQRAGNNDSKQGADSDPQKMRKRRKRMKNRSRECPECKKVFQKVCDLDKHLLVHTGEKPFQCDVCGKRFTQSGNMKSHRLIHTGERPFQCDVCDRKFVRAGDLKSHKVTHSSVKSFKCDICNKAFKTSEYLKSHKEIHSDLRPYTCDECGKGFIKKGGLKAHKIIHTGIKSFRCSMCTKSFYTAGNLKEHELLHTGAKPFPCEICGSKFTKKSSVKKHMMLHTGERPFTCEMCGKGYTNRPEWEIHKRTHTGERPFICDRCDATFHRKANLLQHISAVHLGVRPYICNVCGKAFTEARCLKEHLLIHSGEKPHRCDQCGKAFTQSSTLKAHMRCHSGAKPYSCKHCGKTFSDVSSRNRHHRIHTGEKPYKCSFCNAAFARLELCKAHLLHEHSIVKKPKYSYSKQSPGDHSYDVSLPSSSSTGQSATDQDVKSEILVTKTEDVETVPQSFGPVDPSAGQNQDVNTLQVSAQDLGAADQHFIITVTDGTRIILQTNVNDLPHISTVGDHLTIDHPYVVTSSVTPGVSEAGGSGLTVIELQVVDDPAPKPYESNPTPNLPLVDMASQTSTEPNGEMKEVVDGSLPPTSVNRPQAPQDHDMPTTSVLQSVSEPSNTSCLPMTEAQADDSGNTLAFTYIKSEIDAHAVPESLGRNLQNQDNDLLQTVVVKSEDGIGSVLPSPVILEPPPGSGSNAVAYAVVSSQAEGELAEQRSTSQTGHVEEVTVLPVMGAPVENQSQSASRDGDEAQAEQLEEDNVNLASAEELLDNSRTILRDLLTDPASSSAVKSEKTQEDHRVVKTALGMLRLKKRRYASVPKGFTCEICGHGFTQASSLKKHQILMHSDHKPFVCDECQKGCTSKSELEAHKRIHTGEKPFKCEDCGIALRRKANLEQHIRAVHMQHRPHRCDLCGRRFTEARSLKDHKLIHLGSKPHKCSCGKAFTQLSTLRKHQRTHTGLKQFMCNMCAKMFTDAAALKRHVRLHTGERPYKCEDCTAAFFRSEQLRTHKRNEHPDNLDDLASIALATSI